MKKTVFIIFTLILIAAGGVIAFLISNKEENNASPVERYQEKMEEDAGKSEEETASDGEGENAFGSNIIIHGPVQFELLSYEIIDDSEIQKQTTYPAEYFYEGKLPDSQEYTEQVDYDAAAEECPELKDIWADEGGDKYSVQEVKDIYQANIDVIEKHTTMVPLNKQYVFVKCRITNSVNSTNEAFLNELTVFLSSKDMSTYDFHSDTVCYFDKPVHKEGDDRIHSYFKYSFTANETLECTLGFAVKDSEIENPDYYIGFYEDYGEETNPALTKYVMKLEDIKDSVN